MSFKRGRENPNYNGGLSFNRSLGRWIIVGIDGSWTLYARAVMEAELRRPLRDDEIVHHRNEDPADDRPENLVVLTRSEHVTLHLAKLTAGQAEEIRRRYAAGDGSQRALGAEYGVSDNTISRIVRGAAYA